MASLIRELIRNTTEVWRGSSCFGKGERMSVNVLSFIYSTNDTLKVYVTGNRWSLPVGSLWYWKLKFTYFAEQLCRTSVFHNKPTQTLAKCIQLNSDNGYVNFCSLHRGNSFSISELLHMLANFADPPTF